jgi:alpha-tubulin suppressor-like RCC1 family protein
MLQNILKSIICIVCVWTVSIYSATPLPRVIQVDARWYHSAALRADSTVWHWGLGSISSPTRVSERKWSAVSAGGSSLILLAPDSTLWVRDTAFKVLENGDTLSPVPYLVDSNRWLSISAGDSIAAGIRADSTLWTWGVSFGSHAQVTGKWIAVSAGHGHFLALAADSTLWAWGNNNYGQLGDGTVEERSTPVQINNEKWLTVHAGYQTSHALRADNTAWAWGNNSYLGFSPASPYQRSTPAQYGADTWKKIAPGWYSTLGEAMDGTLWTFAPSSKTSRGSEEWLDFRGNSIHWVLLRADSTLWAAGQNNWEQLGIGQRNNYGFLIQPDSLNLGVVPIPNWPVWQPEPDFESFAVNLNTLVQDQDGDSIAYAVVRAERVRVEFDTPETIRMYSIPGQWQQAKVVFRATDPHGVAYEDSLLFFIPAPTLEPIVEPKKTKVILVAAHGESSYALRTDSTLWAWGNNNQGQLGVGDVQLREKAASVGWASRWRWVSAGDKFAHAIRSDSTLWGWGINTAGQLGNGSTTRSLVPVKIGSMQNWHKVSNGRSHVLALTTQGRLYAWGNNIYGQLGDNTNTRRTSPKLIGSEVWRDVSAGGSHSVGIRADSTLWVWGYNQNGELGQTTSLYYQSAPIQLTDHKWIAVSASNYHTLALRSDSTLWAWGYNNYLQIGNGSSSSQKVTPVQIGSAKWVHIQALPANSIGIQKDGSLWGWGATSTGLLLDDAEQQFQGVPVRLSFTPGLPCAGGEQHLLCPSADSVVYAWGKNNIGQLGVVTATQQSLRPWPYQEGTWLNVSTMGGHFLGVRPDSSLWVWGDNSRAQLGDSILVQSTLPMPFSQTLGTGKFMRIAAGHNHSVVIASDSSLWAWGDNSSYQVGANSSNVVGVVAPTQIATGTWREVAVNRSHNLALAADSTLWAWGKGDFGRLGNGSTSSLYEPTQVNTQRWLHIDAAPENSFGIRADSTLWVWGLTQYGRGGADTVNWFKEPISLVPGKWLQVSGGYYHTAAIAADSTLWTFGQNRYGEVGDSTLLQRSTPYKVNDYKWLQVVAGYHTTYALRADSTLWAWGMNHYGQLGIGTSNHQWVPIQVGTSKWRKLVKGTSYPFALRSDSTLWCLGWKENFDVGALQNPTMVSVPWNTSPRRYNTEHYVEYNQNFGEDSLRLESLFFDRNGDTLEFRVEGADLVQLQIRTYIDTTPTDTVTRTYAWYQSQFNTTGIDTLLIYAKDPWNSASSDSGNGITWVRWILNILPENNAPVIRIPLPDTTVLLGFAPIQISLDEAFVDPDEDAITYSVTGATLTAASIEQKVLRIESLPSTQVGEDTLVVQAQDDLGNIVTDTMRVVITEQAVSIATINQERLDTTEQKVQYDAAGKRIPHRYWGRIQKFLHPTTRKKTTPYTKD